jgi:hypothetical protein
MDGVHLRTLERALEAVGSKERLAIVLDVPAPELEKYLAGEMPLPHKVFIHALDIVASGQRRQANR